MNATARNVTTIKVTFVHPRSEKRLPVDLEPSITPEQVIAELETRAFLARVPEGSAYVLTLERTRQAIPPSGTFEEAGVRDGDVVAIVLAEEGHGGRK